jgi:putative intracellular protease/amidase
LCAAVPSRASTPQTGTQIVDDWIRQAHPHTEWTISVCTGALLLGAKIAGPEVAQTIQLAIEYDPHPPFDAGSPSKAPKPIYDMAVAALGD